MSDRRLITLFGQLWVLTARLRAWSLAVVAASVLVVPMARPNEFNELGSAKERVEDVLPLTRVVGVTRTCFHGRRVVIVFTSSIQARLGRDHSLGPVRADGHRLPNGLLAPKTC